MKLLLHVALASVAAVGCGGDGRSPTAPLLPQPILDAPCSEYDVGADGTIDYVYAFTYDDAGFLTKFVGTPSDTGEYTYDADHFVLQFTEDYDGQDGADHDARYTRDADGRVLTYDVRDGDMTASQAYTYDDAGRLITATQTASDGSSAMYTYVYAGDDLNPTSSRFIYSGGASSSAFTSSADERMVHADIDDGEDGTIDRMTDVTYDAKRRVIDQLATDGAGAFVSHEHYTYDANDQLTSDAYTTSEAGPDDYEYYAQFDTRGLQTERGIRSASGQYQDAVYREVDKTSCGTPTARAAGPRPPRARRLAAELPHLLAVPR
jgi:YD repeat-containing protein